MKKIISLLILILLLIPIATAIPQNDSKNSVTFIPQKQIKNDILAGQYAMEGEIDPETTHLVFELNSFDSSIIANTSNLPATEKLLNPFRFEPYLLVSLICLIIGMLIERKIHWIGLFSGIVSLSLYVLTYTSIIGTVYTIIFAIILSLIISNGFLITVSKERKK